MKINFDTKKSAEAMSAFLQKTSDVGKKALDEAQKSAVAMSEKAKQDSYERRLKKYNPLFPDVYNSIDFMFPSIIVIVDEISRQGIDVCEGAVGWRDTEGDSEVLYLYERESNYKDIQFYPNVMCDSAYYIDPFNPNRYIRVDCIFDKAHEERLAELKNIAHALGAKRCTIEITESSREISSTEKHGKVGLGKAFSAKLDQSSQYASSKARSGKISVEFEGNITPQEPQLKWFAQDENIKNLIKMRCSSDNTIKTETLILSGSSCATMSQKTAASIDSAIQKAKLGVGVSMGSEAMNEHNSKLVFEIEF